MIKGLAITPPILGRISIGGVVERNGKRLPVKEDFFTITSNLYTKEVWIKHPLNDELIATFGQDKLRSIPVRFLFNDPNLNLRSEYSLFDRKTGRPLCVGNGETCRRYSATGVQSLACPSPDLCEFAKDGACKPFGRLNVLIGDDDALGTFIFRTTGFNSLRTIAARLAYLQAVSGNLLASLPLQLRLRGKTSTLSRGSTIYFVDITTRDGMSLNEAICAARLIDKDRQVNGFNQAALDAAAEQGFRNGVFEEDADEIISITEEFFPDSVSNQELAVTTSASVGQVVGLKEKLNQKLIKVKHSDLAKGSFSTEPLS